MLLGFSHLYNFISVFFCFLFFFVQKTENNRLKTKPVGQTFCNIIFLFLFKVGSIRPVDHKISLGLWQL